MASSQSAPLHSLTESYQTLQSTLTDLVSARQKLESQHQENLSVQNEFSSLPDEAKIYKLVGPVLLKQETAEAKSTVGGRLEFIEKEIARIETSIKDLQEQGETKKMEIIRIQQEQQQQEQQAQQQSQSQQGGAGAAVAV